MLLDNIKNYIFDFDGTISDTLNIHKIAFEKALAHLNVKYDYNNYLGKSTNNTIELILLLNKINISQSEKEELVNKKKSIANNLIVNHSIFISGAFELIQLLEKQGKNLFIASSGSKLNVTAGVNALKIENFFKLVVTSDDVKKSKPNPDIFNFIVNKYDLKKEETIVIEDSFAGLQAAISAGLKAICIDKETNLDHFPKNTIAYLSYNKLIEKIK